MTAWLRAYVRDLRQGLVQVWNVQFWKEFVEFALTLLEQWSRTFVAVHHVPRNLWEAQAWWRV